MKKLFAALGAALLAAPGSALAHPGHLSEGAFGHDHYLALAIVGGFAAGLLFAGLYRLWRKFATPALSKHSN